MADRIKSSKERAALNYNQSFITKVAENSPKTALVMDKSLLAIPASIKVVNNLIIIPSYLLFKSVSLTVFASILATKPVNHFVMMVKRRYNDNHPVHVKMGNPKSNNVFNEKIASREYTTVTAHRIPSMTPI
ncbi:hypothetical protein ROZALSC1DRAFT_26398, partial [Rozella allomycis CSF55]